MRIAGKYASGITGVLLLCSGVVHAEAAYSIGYHETIDNMRIAQSTTNNEGGQTMTLSVFAFGKELVMELESHDQLTSSINIGGGARGISPFTNSDDFEALRGRVLDIDGSWVRLTRTGTYYTGVVWDGERLLAIEPFSKVHKMLTNSDSAETGHVIYDTDDMIPLNGQSCAVGSSDPTFEGLVDELQAAPATAASSQINVAFITDSQFTNANPGDVDAAVISRLNVIDGIFSEQVGVKINATEIRQIGANAGLSSNNPSTLLNQFRSFGRSQSSSPGLTHLFTGRNLDGGTIGIAYLNALCNKDFGYGISQADGNTSVVRSALTAAHEFGHNFGSPHDNQPGSSCASTPGNFLMNPSLNGSSEFSQCSLGRISPAVAAASCLVPVSTPDPAPVPDPMPTPDPDPDQVPTPDPTPTPDPAPTPDAIVFSATFNEGNAEGFNFRSDPWGLGNQPQYQSSRLRTNRERTAGALSVVLGGRDNRTVINMSGGFQRTFNLPSTSDLIVSFRAVLRQSSRYESDEVSTLLASLDGQFLGSNADNALASIRGDGNGGETQSTGFRTYRFELEAVPAGQHEITIGGFNNKKTEASELTEILIDDVLIQTSGNRLSAIDSNDPNPTLGKTTWTTFLGSRNR